MKRNKHTLKQWFGLLALPLLMTACTLHEEPELTADGELGVDPTLVNVELTLNLDLNLPEQGNEEESSVRVSANTDYLHRFIVEVYLNRQPVARQVFVENITDRTHLSLPVDMQLHAREYQLVVWKDYVSAETPEEDLHWNTQSLVPVIPNRASHTGNTEYKDVFVGTTSLDLSAYADQWEAEVEQDVVYMQYKTTFEVPEAEKEDLRIGFDYVFVSNEGSVTIPMEVEIVDADNVTVANSVINVSVERGKNTVWTGEFLTGDDQGGQGGGDNPDDEEDGIGFDSEYDGEINIDAPMN